MTRSATPADETARAGTPARRTSSGVLAAVPTAVLAALTLVAGFAVAQAGGVRALGGLVLAAGVAWCAVRSWSAGAARVVAVVLVGAVCFVGAHLLARAVDPWLSVLLAAAVVGAATWFLVDARPAAAATD